MSKHPCEMIEEIPGGSQGSPVNRIYHGNGVNRKNVAPRTIMVRRWAAIGDSLAASVVADKLIALGHDVIWQTHPDIHCVFRRHPRIGRITGDGGKVDVNLDGAYENHPRRRELHFHQIFIAQAARNLAGMGIDLDRAFNCRPELVISDQERFSALEKFLPYPKPWVFVCPQSDHMPSRQVPPAVWSAAAEKIQGTKFWLGRQSAPANFVDLFCRHLDNLIVWLSAADLLVTTDTGPMHIANAIGTPVLAIGQSSSPDLHLSDQTDFMTIQPVLHCLNCQTQNCPLPGHDKARPPCQNINPGQIAAWANAKLMMKYSDGVSAVIPIYQPEASVLNRCLDCVLPQVDEVIITMEGNSRLPDGTRRHEKIRMVKKPLGRIGFGRNVNFGVRHSCHKWLLILNDDVFLKPDAVAKMRECVKLDTGIVSNLLRYPDGLIYYAGKYRNPGMRGWGHINLRERDASIKEPTEMEIACGACQLVRREAFYQVGGFDEDFFCYAEDDDFCLRIARAGWKILFTPHSEGTHMESQSTMKLDKMGMIREGNRIFGAKWGDWYDRNINTIPGVFP